MSSTLTRSHTRRGPDLLGVLANVAGGDAGGTARRLGIWIDPRRSEVGVTTFAILLLTALPHAIRAAEMFPHGGMAVLPAPLILGAVNILPVLLLLIGVPGRARVRAAWVVFVLAQLLALAASALNVYGSATGQ